MLHFFSKIRLRLASENKLGQYIRYAIGEMALIAIGILIALQVNNWNEHNKELKREQKYLVQLLDDFKQEKESLEFEINLNSSRIDFGKSLKQKLKQKQFPDDTVKFIFNAIELGIFSPFTPTLPTFDDLKSSGNLQLIRNAHIKKSIDTYFYRVNLFDLMLYSETIDYKKDFNRKLYKYINPEFRAFKWEMGMLGNQIDLPQEEIDLLATNWNIMTSDNELISNITQCIGAEAQLKSWYNILIEQDLKRIIQLIEHEISEN